MVPSGSLSTFVKVCMGNQITSRNSKLLVLVIMEDAYKYGKKFPAFKKRYGLRR
jgi:hypothetical protein